MIKILSIAIVIVLILAGLGYWRFVASRSNLTTPAADTATTIEQQQPLEVPKTLPQATVDERVKSLEDLTGKLVTQLNGIKTSPPQTQDTRLAAVEAAITELKARVSVLEKASPSPASVSSNKYPVYIPLGSSANNWSNSDWVTVNDFEVSINPNDYPGYTSMSLEVISRVVDPSGTGSVRLYNTTDSSATSSQIDTNSTNFGLKSSSAFTLPSGAKTYKLQVKDSAAKEFYIQTARIKVNL